MEQGKRHNRNQERRRAARRLLSQVWPRTGAQIKVSCRYYPIVILIKVIEFLYLPLSQYLLDNTEIFLAFRPLSACSKFSSRPLLRTACACCWFSPLVLVVGAPGSHHLLLRRAFAGLRCSPSWCSLSVCRSVRVVCGPGRGFILIVFLLGGARALSCVFYICFLRVFARSPTSHPVSVSVICVSALALDATVVLFPISNF